MALQVPIEIATAEAPEFELRLVERNEQPASAWEQRRAERAQPALDPLSAGDWLLIAGVCSYSAVYLFGIGWAVTWVVRRLLDV